jgi:hypothetical protein
MDDEKSWQKNAENKIILICTKTNPAKAGDN